MNGLDGSRFASLMRDGKGGKIDRWSPLAGLRNVAAEFASNKKAVHIAAIVSDGASPMMTDIESEVRLVIEHRKQELVTIGRDEITIFVAAEFAPSSIQVFGPLAPVLNELRDALKDKEYVALRPVGSVSFGKGASQDVDQRFRFQKLEGFEEALIKGMLNGNVKPESLPAAE